MEGSLVQQGLTLMLFGMAVVFAFLILLVFVTSGMSSLVQRFTPAPSPEPMRQPAVEQTPAPHLVAVISAAIHQHRQRDK